jgi:hypothetical protein
VSVRAASALIVLVGASLGVAAPARALITLSSTPVTLSSLSDGSTATGSGTLLITDSSGSWTLQAEDQGAGAGHMTAAVIGCSGSDAELIDPLKVSVSSSVTGVTDEPAISLSGTNQTLATATSAPLTGASFTTSFTQVIPPGELLRSACGYSLTVTYTLQ